MKLYAAATVALFMLAAIQTTPTAAEEQESTSEAISEPPIKLVHVLNPGEREYLSPNLIGVQNIAMTFLPLSMNFVNIIDAFREIVDGVRYEILLNAVDTKAKDADTICRLVILEKPWLTTQWGDKHRELVNTNCSDVADNVLAVDGEDRAKALNDKYVSNTIFNGGRRNELSDSEMAHLEAQILTNDNKRRISSSSSSISTTSTTTSTTAVPPQAVPTNEPITSINVNEAAAAGTADVESDTGDANTSTATPMPIGMTTPTAELNENEKRWLDDILSVGAFNFEKTIEEQRTELKQQQQQQDQQREETAQAEELEQQKEPVDEEQEQTGPEQQEHLEQDAQQSSLS